MFGRDSAPDRLRDFEMRFPPPDLPEPDLEIIPIWTSFRLKPLSRRASRQVKPYLHRVSRTKRG